MRRTAILIKDVGFGGERFWLIDMGWDLQLSKGEMEN